MSKIKFFLICLLVALLPLFFLPITQEFFLTGKTYLLAFIALVLLLISTLEIFINKKIAWRKSKLDSLLFLLVATLVLTVIFTSVNRVAALINVNFGFVQIVSFVVLAFYLLQTYSPEKRDNYLKILNLSVFISALIFIFFFFSPFKNATLPVGLQFLKSPYFSTVGTPLDIAILTGFMFVVNLAHLFNQKKTDLLALVSIFVYIIALVIAGYFLLKPGTVLLLPPYRLSWYAAVEILKNPATGFLGVGLDNYSSLFTRVKDLAYNQNPLWQISGFNISRSFFLHIFSVAGLATSLVVILLFIVLFRELRKNSARDYVSFAAFAYVVFVFVLFPPSLITLFLILMLMAIIPISKTHEQSETDLKNLPPVYIGVGVILLVVIAACAYGLGRVYTAEYFFKQSLNGYLGNNAADVYNNQRQAILLNPYSEDYHLSFSQTNLAIANSIAQRARTKDANNKQVKLTDQEKQTITQAIQAAIAEAKAALILNPQKATNWQNLAEVYRSIISVAKQADVFTISAYQRALSLDPNNPVYRLNLGGVYYTLADYTDAVNLFNQSISLKSDWANAYYNLAWAQYQNKNYQQAASAMQSVLTLVDKNADPTDYKKAKKELEQFKAKIPAAGSKQNQSGSLNLPQQPNPELSPKIELPKSASPEAH